MNAPLNTEILRHNQVNNKPKGSNNPNQAIKDPAAHDAAKLEKRLLHNVGKAISDFNMIEQGDRVMVCLSGGKDSYAMLDILLKMQARAPIDFKIVAVNLDQKQPGFPAHILPEYLQKLGVEYHIETQDTYSIVKRNIPEGNTMCSLCSRLRRAILYRVASELGCKKVALGHHRDDILATFFLNMFYGGRMKAMPAKLVSDNGQHIVIRPLAYVKESDLVAYAYVKQFPIIPCTLCGSQENLQRKQMNIMMRDWEIKFPGRVETAFNALGRAVPSHLLDSNLYDFANLKTQNTPFEGGDIGFDEDEGCAPAVAAQTVQWI